MAEVTQSLHASYEVANVPLVGHVQSAGIARRISANFNALFTLGALIFVFVLIIVSRIARLALRVLIVVATVVDLVLSVEFN